MQLALKVFRPLIDQQDGCSSAAVVDAFRRFVTEHPEAATWYPNDFSNMFKLEARNRWTGWAERGYRSIELDGAEPVL